MMVYIVNSSAQVLDALNQYKFCLVILDYQQLEDQHFKAMYMIQQQKTVPILAITNKVESDQKVRLYHAGVHAHIEKPTAIEVCAAQADSLIRLYNSGIAHRYQEDLVFGTELMIQSHFRQVFVHGQPLELTRKEFDLLYFLAQYPYQVFSYEQLYSHVWKDDYAFGGENTVKVHIVTLRKKLSAINKNCIQNVWGIGYKFVPPNFQIDS